MLRQHALRQHTLRKRAQATHAQATHAGNTRSGNTRSGNALRQHVLRQHTLRRRAPLRRRAQSTLTFVLCAVMISNGVSHQKLSWQFSWTIQMALHTCLPQIVLQNVFQQCYTEIYVTVQENCHDNFNGLLHIEIITVHSTKVKVLWARHLSVCCLSASPERVAWACVAWARCLSACCLSTCWRVVRRDLIFDPNGPPYKWTLIHISFLTHVAAWVSIIYTILPQAYKKHVQAWLFPGNK